ncbi:protein SPIRAL1-like protein 5 [Cinnamomum micranthum f. kanehirae]|uniref:Protein SPIRAL1-like protein 5 n=1 Tax=Cinnamomum micranthum f. kanehirae TaxID=337451 RepID=A0A3S3NW88_9MAGN|nr:protein SPIRAL1-like protein 5 [Cinnamomum micranthum f. kanehirae]
MSRGGSYGGGQSSLGYLFGSDESSSPSSTSGKTKKTSSDDKKAAETTPAAPSPKQTVSANNYHRAQGQNTGNFITDRPTTKVHSVPGGDSSLGYLFGDK